MPQQLLRDPTITPTPEIISAGLGSANSVYLTFIEKIQGYSVSLMDWRYYNDGKAWLSKGEYRWTTSRGTNKVKPLFWLSMWEGFFKVSFFFSAKIESDLLSLPISKSAIQVIQNSKPMGKTMRFMPVIFDITESSQLDDLFVLMQFRKEKI